MQLLWKPLAEMVGPAWEDISTLDLQAAQLTHGEAERRLMGFSVLGAPGTQKETGTPVYRSAEGSLLNRSGDASRTSGELRAERTLGVNKRYKASTLPTNDDTTQLLTGIRQGVIHLSVSNTAITACNCVTSASPRTTFTAVLPKVDSKLKHLNYALQNQHVTVTSVPSPWRPRE
ncbi:hypothetical protein SKAU_G00047670 [Synaphobranchus kaupii]|uniref:Uncharacterized protein n=1 Tax=Synaphobranchus kaupii TaxID=118154 RepID=A0A9Q1G3C1_SYNKA|nr:hypothetical protein SKAU_G00047670 [Synaphobranchus kaupii]